MRQRALILLSHLTDYEGIVNEKIESILFLGKMALYSYISNKGLGVQVQYRFCSLHTVQYMEGYIFTQCTCVCTRTLYCTVYTSL